MKKKIELGDFWSTEIEEQAGTLKIENGENERQVSEVWTPARRSSVFGLD